jgi:hypothetical protein
MPALITLREDIIRELSRLREALPLNQDTTVYDWAELERRVAEISPSPAALKYAVDLMVANCDYVPNSEGVLGAIGFATHYEQQEK